jgi:putative lipoprotein
MMHSHRGSGNRVKIRFGFLLFGAIVLAGCSWMPHFGKSKPPAPAQETLMKSLAGEVDFSAVSSLPPDAILEVTLSDVSRQDAPARVIANDSISPVGASPANFVLTYEPKDLGDGVDFAVSARIHQGDKLLAISDTRVSVLGRSGNTGPVQVVVTPVQ